MNLNRLSSPPVTLDLGEYSLRELRASDAAAWYAYLSQPEVTCLTSYDIQSVDVVSAMINDYINGYTQKTSTRWALVRKDSDTLIGTCGYYGWHTGYSIAELGYDLSQDYWGKNIMTSAVRAVVAWGFETLEINRIQATVMVDNVGSARVLEKNHFQKEGTLRDYKIARGQYRDFWMFSLLQKDYSL